MASKASITRRSALTSIAAIPACGLAPIVPAMAAPVEAELPVTKVNRLAKELSVAMDDWCADMGIDGEPDVWKAHVYPSKHMQYPVMFEHVGSRDDASDEPHELDVMLADFLAKLAAWEGMVPPHEDLTTDCDEYRAADEVVHRIMDYRCASLADLSKKAAMIRDHWWLNEHCEDHLDDFLATLIA